MHHSAQWHVRRAKGGQPIETSKETKKKKKQQAITWIRCGAAEYGIISARQTMEKDTITPHFAWHVYPFACAVALSLSARLQPQPKRTDWRLDGAESEP